MMVNEKRKNDFTVGSMWVSIVRMAIPMTLAQLVNVLYSIVDRMYIGHIPEIGSLAITGLGIAMPVVSIVSAFANLCGVGGGTLCSIARGEGNIDKAEKIMANALTMLLFFSIVLMITVQHWMRPILFFFGASEATYPYAADYMRVYMVGTVFAMLSLGMNSFINSQGFGTTGMLTVSIGAIVNIVLDPILIFGLNLGIRGAAIATVIAQICSALWAMGFLLSKKAILDLKLKNMIPNLPLIGRISALGTTGFVAGITTGLVHIVCNTQLQAFGGDLYVGAMTIIFSVREVMHMVVQGMSSGAQPVIGYNYGAKQYLRVKTGIQFITVFCVSYAAISWAFIMIAPEILVGLFNKEPELLKITSSCMRIHFCGFIFMSLQQSAQHSFLSLGKGKQAVFFSLLRKVFIVIPMVLLLPNIPSLGVNGVFWAEPISDVVSGLACFGTMYFTIYKKLGKRNVNI